MVVSPSLYLVHRATIWKPRVDQLMERQVVVDLWKMLAFPPFSYDRVRGKGQAVEEGEAIYETHMVQSSF